MFSLFRRNKDKKGSDIRNVRFGIRSRFLTLLSIVMILVISALALVMYLNQRRLLEDEKNTKASSLTHILSGPARFYLDKTIETTDEALKIKYETISRDASSFTTYNSDIVKIVLTDDKGKVRYSTDKKDYRKRKTFPYIAKCLKQEDEKLMIYDYAEEIKSKIKKRKTTKKKGKNKKRKKDDKKKKIKKIKYRAITYPLFLHEGNVIDILKDYRKYYKKYHESGTRERKRIYSILWKKYKDRLGKKFNPKKKPKKRSLSKKIVKAGDLDFLFLKLFGKIMILRDKRVKKSERWLFRNNWLYKEKNKKRWAYLNDLSDQANKINDRIISRMNALAKHVENIRRLGALAIIFNIDMIKTELDQTINQVMIMAIIMILIGIILFRFVLNFIIQNLKKLERWAISVGEGNLDNKIIIKTNDEIGRLSDVFNHMIDEIAIKYHLEKFVSRSTKSMIGKKADTSDELNLGGTGRKNMIFIFSDVRGFTSFSEQNDPETVIDVLNFYLDLQAKVIKSKKGDIDDYTGDEIMAHFSGDRRVDRAIESAVAIMKTIVKENAERLKKELPIFEVGIGIHGGDVVTGNIGSSFRMDFTCIGDAVNLSARLCSHAKAGEILVSKDIFERAKKKHEHTKIPSIAVKGKEKKILVVKIKVKN